VNFLQTRGTFSRGSGSGQLTIRSIPLAISGDIGQSRTSDH
jgi:hypothetical protein